MRPFFPSLETISSRVDRALSEGLVTNNGPYVLDFEALLTHYLGLPTLCFASGTAALTALLMAVDVYRQEVIIPSFTFAATADAVLAAGGIPVFADINRDTLTLSPADVERKITPQTGAILAVDVYGIGADYETLQKVADVHGVRLLRDSAPAFGTSNPGADDVPGIYSLHATKAFAVGEGGCLVSKDYGLIAKAKEIRNFGFDRSGDWKGPGINGKMTEISALIGIQSLKTWRERLLGRVGVKARLDAYLSNIEGLTPVPIPLGQSVSWCYCPVLINPDKFGCHRVELAYLLEQAGIFTRKYYPALHQEPFAKAADLRGNNLPVTERIADQVLALPCYESMTVEETAFISSEIRRIKESVAK